MAVKVVVERKFRQLRLLMWKNWLFSVSENFLTAKVSPLSLALPLEYSYVLCRNLLVNLTLIDSQLESHDLAVVCSIRICHLGLGLKQIASGARRRTGPSRVARGEVSSLYCK